MITLEEISHYLPYGLKVQFLGSPNKEHANFTGEYRKYIGNGNSSYDEWFSLKILKIGMIRKVTIRKGYAIFHVGKAATYLKSCGQSEIWPILKPMSDLTKDELRKQGFSSHIDYLTHEQFCDQKYKFPILRAPFEMIQYLFKNHYDVFGLIERGDAIDINSLT